MADLSTTDGRRVKGAGNADITELSAASKRVTNVGEPTDASDAVTKNYVDTNLPTVPNGLETISAPEGDSVVAQQPDDTLNIISSDSSVRVEGNDAATRLDFKVSVNSLTDIGDPVDTANDLLMIYDVSTGNNRKVTPDDLGISGGGGGSGDVVGPTSTTDNAVPRFDGGTGKLLQSYTSNPFTVSDTGVPSARDDNYVGSQRFGLNASVTGDDGTAFGQAATAGNSSVAVGKDADADHIQTIVIGDNAIGGGNSSVIIGQAAVGNSSSNVGIGHAVDLDGNFNVCIGKSTQIIAGNQATVIGSNSVGGNGAVIYGANIDGTGFTSSTLIGRSVVVSGSQAVAIGVEAESAVSAASVGFRAKSNASSSIAIGQLAEVTAVGGVALGYGSLSDTDYSIAIGHDCETEGFSNIVAIGRGNRPLQADTFLLGGPYQRLSEGYLGHGNKSVSNFISDFTLQPSRTSGTWNDLRGGDFTLRGGTSTGTAIGGSVKLDVAPAGVVSGTTENTSYVDMFEVNGSGEVIQTMNNAATADGSLWNGSGSFYLDEAGNQVIIKVKYSDGTVKTGSIPLT